MLRTVYLCFKWKEDRQDGILNMCKQNQGTGFVYMTNDC